MGLPSIKKLAGVFGDKAKQARKILELDRAELLDLPENGAWLKQCYNLPTTHELRMNALNVLGQFRGVECIENRRNKFNG